MQVKRNIVRLCEWIEVDMIKFKQVIALKWSNGGHSVDDVVVVLSLGLVRFRKEKIKEF